MHKEWKHAIELAKKTTSLNKFKKHNKGQQGRCRGWQGRREGGHGDKYGIYS